ncbi:MAG TPA: RNA 2',3'-cyclic phosphodiesterase [Planctomycetota bacterium]|nr:RNA 2',3'-cyclic phosphodiesterase [Planctomycetota bacterium]
MRCFVAVNVAEPVRDLLVRVQDSLRRADAPVRWVERENLHLTLKFLGDLDDDHVASLRRLLADEAARWRPMTLLYGGIGAFPERGAPRVIWAGAVGDIDRMAGLAAALDRHGESLGVPRERHPFVAHLTIGRVKSDRNLKRLQAALEDQREVSLGRDDVTAFDLVQSTLRPEGPLYSPVETFLLGGVGGRVAEP